MKHFANFLNPYETGLKNLLTQKTENIVFKYKRAKKEKEESSEQ